MKQIEELKQEDYEQILMYVNPKGYKFFLGITKDGRYTCMFANKIIEIRDNDYLDLANYMCEKEGYHLYGNEEKEV